MEPPVIGSVLAVLADDVAWANGMDGGHVHGRDDLAPKIYPTQSSSCLLGLPVWAVEATGDGAIIAEVRQSVRDLEGKPLQGQTTVLKTRRSGTFSVFERARWLASTSRITNCLSPGVRYDRLSRRCLSKSRLSTSFEYLFRLNRQTEGYFTRAIEYLKDMIADHATIFTCSPVPGIQFNSAVASPAFGTDDVGPSHREKLSPHHR